MASDSERDNLFRLLRPGGPTHGRTKAGYRVITRAVCQHTARKHLATIGRHLVAGVRCAATSLRHAHHEQVLMWELWSQANRATVPAAGPLRWVLTLDGMRLAGDHLPAPHHADARDAV